MILFWAALSAFRSQSFLQTIFSSIEFDTAQKRISAQVGLRVSVFLEASAFIRRLFSIFV